MLVFERNSRYVLYSSLLVTTDLKGRQVPCVLPAHIPPAAHMGIHRRREEQRLDHLANRYLADPTGFWRIAAHNGALTVEQLAEAPLLLIPVKGS